MNTKLFIITFPLGRWNRSQLPKCQGQSAVCILSLLFWSLSCVWRFVTLWTVACRAHLPWDFPGENTGVGYHFLLQGIFLTQGSNSSLLLCSQSHQGSPFTCILSVFSFWQSLEVEFISLSFMKSYLFIHLTMLFSILK